MFIQSTEQEDITSYNSDPIIAPGGDYGPRILGKMDSPASQDSSQPYSSDEAAM